MNKEFCDDILSQIVEQVTAGKRRLLVWGFTDDAIYLLAQLKQRGLMECIVAIVDANPMLQGFLVQGLRVLTPSEIPSIDVDVLVVAVDAEKESVLSEYRRVDSRIPSVIISGVDHFSFRDETFDKILASCLVKSYANGYENSLIHIYQSIKYLAENNIRANVAEFGIFKGGTITFIAKTLEHFGFGDVRVLGFDIFEGFPAKRTLLDLYSNPKCEFRDYDAVVEHCRRNRIEVVKGDICETYKQVSGIPLMLSFFDTDNYSPTRAALDLCYEQTVRGGVLAFDHYISEGRFVYTIGERMAAREVLYNKNMFHLHGTGIFLKV
jgi:O-methyltransferase